MKYLAKKYAMAGCVSMLLAGCASNATIAPEYRLSSSSAQIVPDASMLQRGRAQLGAGLEALAIESFRAEIRQNPDSADAYNGLAVAYDRLGRADLAQRYFETALAKEPANTKVQANLAKLNNEKAPAIQFATNVVAEPLHDPVAVTQATDDDAIGQISKSSGLASLAMTDFAKPEPISTTVKEVLSERGVLSARFIAAPMQLATNATTAASIGSPLRKLPDRKPSNPGPSLPPATLLTDARKTGTRLERVSLGEVRLVTLKEPTKVSVTVKLSFASFGDRLSIWLPQTIAMESARSGLPDESRLMLAASELVHQNENVLALGGNEQLELELELEQFTYIFFNSELGAVG